MIPDLPNLSSPVISDKFLSPYNRVKSPRIDYARGGVALLDPSRGLDVKNWVCELEEDGSCYLSSQGVSNYKIETFIDEPDWISITFDQNMHYNLTYTVPDSGGFLYWYDAEQNKYATKHLGNVTTPFLRMDDVRKDAYGQNDIILSYLKGKDLCVRIQRERFEQEYVLWHIEGTKIVQCGMNRKMRFQWYTL